MGPRTADSTSKNEKATTIGSCVGPAKPRLRSSSDGNIYTRRAGGRSSSSSLTLSNPKSVLRRPVSTEELTTPGGPYIKKTFTIVGDAVGWGFVVRGRQPCYIQAVEPFGPAAAAGMKVRQFVVSVNGLNVLDLDYRTVSHLILTGPRTVVMEGDVLETDSGMDQAAGVSLSGHLDFQLSATSLPAHSETQYQQLEHFH